MFRRLDISLANPGEGLRPIAGVGPVFSRSNMSSMKPQGLNQTGRCSAQQAFALGVSEQI